MVSVAQLVRRMLRNLEVTDSNRPGILFLFLRDARLLTIVEKKQIRWSALHYDLVMCNISSIIKWKQTHITHSGSFIRSRDYGSSASCKKTYCIAPVQTQRPELKSEHPTTRPRTLELYCKTSHVKRDSCPAKKKQPHFPWTLAHRKCDYGWCMLVTALSFVTWCNDLTLRAMSRHECVMKKITLLLDKLEKGRSCFVS